jgi:AcrR family transcriptional regulator
MAGQQKSRGQRAYRMSRRRVSLEGMRQRIAEAAFELHATVGPAHTSIKAVAERAGVQRHTVYHHFPDMTSLVRACTEHGMRVTRIPEPEPWLAIEDPTARLRLALGELYAYYRANARLLGNVVRDMPMMAEGGVEAFVERMGELFGALAAGWPDDAPTQRLRMVAIGHAMSFETWKSLTSNGLTDGEAADLMLQLVTGIESRAAAKSRPDQPGGGVRL